MKMRKRKVKAYFTVEASLVLPIVIGSIIFVICFLLYWYNRCLMEQDVSMYTIRAAQMTRLTAEDVPREMTAWRREYLTDKHYAWESSDLYISLKHNEIRITRTGRLLLGDRIWNAEVACAARRMDQAGFLRLCRRLEQKDLEEKK